MRRWWVSLLFLSLAGLIVFSGCAKKEQIEVTPPPVVEPEPVYEEPYVEPEPEPEPLELKTIHFDYDKYNLKSEATSILNKNAEMLMNYPDARIKIEGHCDERGTNQYNLSLGQKRADAAKSFLINYGISADRISTISYGEERPVCNGHDESCWWRNRRAEFVIIE
ncbi:peptidoglycan-associated lipoprotein Pal [bacterium]|nr:peptidoglycan-associated lipoprotein Pal [bacterium]